MRWAAKHKTEKTVKTALINYIFITCLILLSSGCGLAEIHLPTRPDAESTHPYVARISLLTSQWVDIFADYSYLSAVGAGLEGATVNQINIRFFVPGNTDITATTTVSYPGADTLLVDHDSRSTAADGIYRYILLTSADFSPFVYTAGSALRIQIEESTGGTLLDAEW